MTEFAKLTPHPEFPSYLFSPEGKVFRLKNGKLRPMLGTKCGEGYRAIDFCRDGKRVKREYIHRVICELFNGPAGKGMQCRHLDGDMTNNAASNLAWGTPRENHLDKRRHGTCPSGERNPMAVLTQEKVHQMRAVRQREKKPYHAIAKEFGVSTMTAFRAVTRRAWV